ARVLTMNREIASEMMVRKVRRLLRSALLITNRQSFIAGSLPSRSGPGQNALVQVHDPVRALRGVRVVGHHDDRLLEVRVQLTEQVEDLLRGLRVEVSGRLGGDPP